MMPVARRCAGVTVVELMVVLVLLGLMAAVVGLSWQRELTPMSIDAGVEKIAAARHQALSSGRAVRIAMMIEGHSVTVAALPDGRVIAPVELHVDVLTGMPIRD
jgi:Tfp pilus assembly protein FimT